MIVKPIFEQTTRYKEQSLIDRLTQEIIQIHGINTYYIPANRQNFDPIYGASDTTSYNDAYLIEMYVKNVFGFEGDREFMSKVAGLEIRDQIIFSVSRTRFMQEIGETINSTRPREADLIFFPQNNKCFQIKYVNQYEMFYQMGKIYTWEMTCELFEYSDETFNTGVPEIDRIQTIASTNILDYLLRDVDGTPLLTENGDFLVTDAYNFNRIDPLADNVNVQTEEESKGYIDWDNTRPFGEFSSDDTGSHQI
jgi:hypothetical protein